MLLRAYQGFAAQTMIYRTTETTNASDGSIDPPSSWLLRLTSRTAEPDCRSTEKAQPGNRIGGFPRVYSSDRKRMSVDRASAGRAAGLALCFENLPATIRKNGQ